MSVVVYSMKLLSRIIAVAQFFRGWSQQATFSISHQMPLIPQVLHRSHKYTLDALQSPKTEAEKRVQRNIDSCNDVNPEFTTLYYDDRGVDETMTVRVLPMLKAETPKITYVAIKKAWSRLSSDKILKHHFVLKSDVFRLAIVYLEGGWWLDADVVCLDPITQVLGSKSMQEEIQRAALRSNHVNAINDEEEECAEKYSSDAVGCVWAWEGSVPSSTGSSSPLNWAFGCMPRHPLPLAALYEAAKNINVWAPVALDRSSAEFSAREHVNGKLVALVDVLRLTGPALVEKAIENLIPRSLLHHKSRKDDPSHPRLGEVRRLVVGEDPSDASSWDRAFYLSGLTTRDQQLPWPGALLVLPYCFFRSRGCAHLKDRFDDRVMFHHEFDTAWRPSFWHNYLE